VGFTGQSDSIVSDLDFSHDDIILYYELLDNWLNLDLGLNFKHFNGYTYFYSDSIIEERAKIDAWVPMLYAKGQFDLPFTGFSASITGEALSFDGNQITDLAAAINYESDSDFGAQAGYRDLSIDLQRIGTLKSNITVDGFYLGVNFHF
jgi:outer membrane protein